MWHVEVWWEGAWAPLPGEWEDLSAAEWACARWRQDHKCFQDPFRVVKYRETSKE